ncbi:alpha/beta fold hydrolase [Pedobacter fastidiosus]|uniref:Alpha/beta hydrolase n=1 Tax=Pedobacter fastidiosus TaxID=2765361 RepID=A0ABR7KX70_9SPHI|nr:alpha/beta hydrolase [Pedobacter fastidiosus]MBC6112707.1 alpha/beta hydrolase [Pedobacter fastidiosus]
MTSTPTAAQQKISDEQLIKDFPGFDNHYIEVNGIRIHYVDGGAGKTIICLPGWPQTWYSYQNIATEFSKKHRVIVVDIRGMGTSERPENGYDKKTMAEYIKQLIHSLDLKKVTIIGHDIGGMVAMSLAFNHPGVVEKLIVADGLHPNEGMLQMPLLPTPGTFGQKMNGNMPYAWWMGFNQVKSLPEKILEGRFRFLVDYVFDYVMIDETKISDKERNIYAEAYNDAESIRASNAWYQAFGQDIEDSKTYQKLEMPVLGIGSNVSYQFMKMAMPYLCRNSQLLELSSGGHYMFEENPDQVIEAIYNFLKP